MRNLLLSLFASLSINALAQIPATGRIASWCFTGNSNDISGYGNDAVNHNAVLQIDRFNNSSSAYLFNGTSNYLEVPDNPALRLSNIDFTISVWVYQTAYNSNGADAILSKRTSQAQHGYIFSLKDSGGFGWPTFHISGGSDPFVTATQYVQKNNWTYLTVVYHKSAQICSLYVNSVLSGMSSSIPPPYALTTTDLLIGADNGGGMDYYFNGEIDDINIYNRALSNAEISQLYNATNCDTLSPNGISDISEVKYTVYPNPAANILTIENIQPKTPITITNLLGEIVLNCIAESDRKVIEIAILPKGVYFLNKTMFIKE